MAQSNPHHTLRWYVPHHFVALPLAFVLTCYAGWHYTQVAGDNTTEGRLWFTVAAVAAVLTLTLILLRQHYALGLQDRLIRLEVRQRYFELTGTSLRPLEARLSLKQLTVLRFASDEQLPGLAQAAASENLATGVILERIGDGYQADPLRV